MTDKKKVTDNKPSLEETRQALEELDRVFHEKARLGILTCMVGATDPLGFNHLKELCQLTDGNLNRHLKVLVDASVVKVKKTGSGRTTNSTYSLTKLGRRSFVNYIEALETIVESARSVQRNAAQDISFA